MSERWKQQLACERGATIPLVAVCLVVLIGSAAIAVDLGMLLDTRNEAQRAADAAALAGASALIEYPSPQDEEMMRQRAIEYAGLHRMRGEPILPEEVTSVELDQSTRTVRVTIQRAAVGTWFANIFGISSTPIGARAAAMATQSGSANCLKPFAIPDDAYTPDDYGTLVKLWQVGDDDFVLVGYNDNEPPGLGEIRTSISSKCIDGNAAALDDELLWEKPSQEQGHSGDGVGQVMNGMRDLFNSDNLEYNPDSDPPWSRDDWASSKRVGRVVTYDREAYTSGTKQIVVKNFLTVYFSHTTGQAGNPNNPYTVWGRIFPAAGLNDGCVNSNCSPNTFYLRLVE
jgi:Flp pilus assembly protein TadG